MRDGKSRRSWFSDPLALWVVALVVPAVVFLLWPMVRFALPGLLERLVSPFVFAWYGFFPAYYGWYGFYVPGVLLLAALVPGSWKVRTAHILAYVLALSILRVVLLIGVLLLYPNF